MWLLYVNLREARGQTNGRKFTSEYRDQTIEFNQQPTPEYRL